MEALRFGMSSCGAPELRPEDFEAYAAAGVQELEISLGTIERYDAINWKELEKRANESGVHLWSFHLPFTALDKSNVSSMDREIRENSIRYISEMMKKAMSIGIKIFVVHPSRECIYACERAERIKVAQESMGRLADVAGMYGVVAVENLPRTCLGRNSTEIKQLLEADGRLKVCFDTNHLLAQPIKEFILDVGDRIITTHFSDYDFLNERHWLPGEGKINWVEVIETLEQVRYAGPILYELGFLPQDNIERRKLTVEDFRRNHNLLINKLPLEVIGEPSYLVPAI